jgi:hypothetical protein
MEDLLKRQKKSEYQRKWRAKKTNQPPVPSILTKPELVIDTNTIPLKYKPKKAKKIPLKDSSISTYTSKLRAFHLRMTGLPLSQNIIDAIQGNDYDKKAIQDEFKYLFEKTNFIISNETNSIPNLCKVFTKIPGFIKLIKILVPIKRNIELAHSIRRNDTTIHNDDLISFNKPDILLNASKVTDNHDKLLYLLMTLIPTRRLDDYRSMTFGISNGNYFLNDSLYIKDTNTKNKKSITIILPPEILELLQLLQSLTNNDSVDNSFILGRYHSPTSLSRKFSNIMFKLYSKKIGALDLRRMYLTTINKSSPSFIERKAVADAVGHSVEESIKYSLKLS